jgi:hypothetical protein
MELYCIAIRYCLEHCLEKIQLLKAQLPRRLHLLRQRQQLKLGALLLLP